MSEAKRYGVAGPRTLGAGRIALLGWMKVCWILACLPTLPLHKISDSLLVPEYCFAVVRTLTLVVGISRWIKEKWCTRAFGPP